MPAAACPVTRTITVPSGDEEAERVPRRVGEHVQRLVRLIGPVEEELGAQGLGSLALPLELVSARPV